MNEKIFEQFPVLETGKSKLTGIKKDTYKIFKGNSTLPSLLYALFNKK